MRTEKVPEWFRKTETVILLKITAEACGWRRPSLRGLRAEESLSVYQRFSAEVMRGRSLQELKVFRRKMYKKAYRIGRLISLLPGVGDTERKKKLIVFLYRLIEIEIREEMLCDAKQGSGCSENSESGRSLKAEGTRATDRAEKMTWRATFGTRTEKMVWRTASGTRAEKMAWRISIPRCSFSRFYTPETCYVMSGLDAGIICGVFGGGCLRFNRRLTEGYEACSAVYEARE